MIASAIVAFVGTTLAPWRLFLAQNAATGRRELVVGSASVVAGALAVVLLAASALGYDAVARVPRDVLLAVALLDAAVIVASVLSRARSGAGTELGDSANRRIADVLTFYAAYGLLVTAIAVVMLVSHSSLGLLANTVPLLGLLVLACAGVSVVLLTDGRRALGPGMLSERVRRVRSTVVAVLAMLALVLAATAGEPLPGTTTVALLFGVGAFLALAIAVGARRRPRGAEAERPAPAQERARIALARLGRFWLIVVPASAIVAVPLVLVQLLVRAWWRP